MATKVQFERVIDELAQDCESDNFYLNAAGATCAIGHLARKAGVSDDVLIMAGSTPIIIPPDYGTVEARALEATQRIIEAVAAEFGLTQEEQNEIQTANDKAWQEWWDERVIAEADGLVSPDDWNKPDLAAQFRRAYVVSHAIDMRDTRSA
jgi:hypothetical protein